MRDAWRGLRRSPGFSLAVVLILATGIGLNTTLFNVLNAVLLRPLPGFETDRLAMLYERTARGGSNWARIETFREWRRQAQSFEQLEAGAFFEMNLTGDQPAEQINTAMLTPRYFSLYRMRPALGREFVEEEGQPGHGQVAVLDYHFWQRRFGGDERIVGQAITLDRRPYIVVGIAARDFHPLGETVQVYRPFAVADPPVGAAWVIGRLRRGVGMAAARAEMAAISARLRDSEADVVPAIEPWVSNIRPLLLLLAGAAGVVLLIACLDAAGLLLARGSARQREFAIRRALGATDGRLAWQTVAEGSLLALAAGALSIPIAWRAAALLKWLRLDGVPRLDEVSLDGRVLAFAAAASLLTGVLASVIPARGVGSGAPVFAPAGGRPGCARG